MLREALAILDIVVREHPGSEADLQGTMDSVFAHYDLDRTARRTLEAVIRLARQGAFQPVSPKGISPSEAEDDIAEDGIHVDIQPRHTDLRRTGSKGVRLTKQRHVFLSQLLLGSSMGKGIEAPWLLAGARIRRIQNIWQSLDHMRTKLNEVFPGYGFGLSRAEELEVEGTSTSLVTLISERNANWFGGPFDAAKHFRTAETFLRNGDREAALTSTLEAIAACSLYAPAYALLEKLAMEDRALAKKIRARKEFIISLLGSYNEYLSVLGRGFSYYTPKAPLFSLVQETCAQRFQASQQLLKRVKKLLNASNVIVNANLNPIVAFMNEIRRVQTAYTTIEPIEKILTKEQLSDFRTICTIFDDRLFGSTTYGPLGWDVFFERHMRMPLGKAAVEGEQERLPQTCTGDWMEATVRLLNNLLFDSSQCDFKKAPLKHSDSIVDPNSSSQEARY